MGVSAGSIGVIVAFCIGFQYWKMGTELLIGVESLVDIYISSGSFEPKVVVNKHFSGAELFTLNSRKIFGIKTLEKNHRRRQKRYLDSFITWEAPSACF
mmetsp:Transcript_3868/g.4824  ORF Transcript_3868/g.4824 Transcript_3868/m.4824 type:complete len:99 (-) Transcript_3868:31-327(-)